MGRWAAGSSAITGRRWCSASAASTSSLITNNGQAVDLAQFTSLGIDPTRYTTVAVKSMQHFRAAFEPIAREVVLVDTGALCSEIYTPELFTKVRRPIWPLDTQG